MGDKLKEKSTRPARLLSLFSREEKRRAVLLSGLVVLTGAAEVVGVAAILPFMQVVAQPGVVETNRHLRTLYYGFGFGDRTHFLIFLGVGVLVFIALANLLKAFTTRMRLVFAWTTASNISIRLMGRYLHQPYGFYLDKNPTGLGKQVLGECKQLVNAVLVPMAEVVSYGVVALAMIGLLLATDVRLTLIAFFLFGGSYMLIYVLFSRRLNRLGEQRYDTNRRLYITALEALGNVKSLLIRGCQNFFVERYADASQMYASVQATALTISQLPRYFIEVVAFGSIIITILFLLTTEGGLEQIIPKLSLFALAGYRLIPSLQNIFKSAATYRFNNHLIDELYEEFHVRTVDPMLRPPGREPVSFSKEIKFEGVSFAYPRSDTKAVDNVTLKVRKSERVAFVGSTGSGKSTLVDIIVGLLEPTDGRVTVDGVPISARNDHSWRNKVGYVPQDVVLYDESVARNIAYGLPDEEIDYERVLTVAKISQAHDFVYEMPSRYETNVGHQGNRLSGGQRQRIGLARALYHRPQILVLDEATSALDNITERKLILGLKQEGLTLVMVAHRLSTVRDCDRIYLMDAGRVIASGSYDSLLERSPGFRDLVSAVTG